MSKIATVTILNMYFSERRLLAQDTFTSNRLAKRPTTLARYSGWHSSILKHVSFRRQLYPSHYLEPVRQPEVLPQCHSTSVN